MRFSIGHRLFACVLLAILAVAAAGIGLMRHNVMGSFAEYAVSIELDRLDELSGDLARQYRAQGSWRFIPEGATERKHWISAELERLQGMRASGAAVVPPVPPVAPVAPVIPVPPLPPEPTLPPLPAPPPPPAAPVPQFVDHGIEQLPLQQRVTLLDARSDYVAGRRPGQEPSAQRPIVVAGKTVGYLVVAKALRPSDAMSAAFLDQLSKGVLAIVAVSVALSALAAVLLAGHFRKPIQRLADGAHALAEGRYDTRIDVSRSDELGELAHSFNQLAQRLAKVDESRRQWVADTSHELRTPLSVLRAQLEAIQDGVRDADAHTLDLMLRQVMALNKLIDELYALARADVGQLDFDLQSLNAWDLVTQQAAAFADKLEGAELGLEIGPAPAKAIVSADPDRLAQLFANLLENSVRYTRAGGKVALHAQVDGPWLAVLVDDSAPGVPADALPHLAERFYRVDQSRHRALGGAGLGLALCQRIAEAHGATLDFAASPLGGLRVRVRLKLEHP